MLQRKLKTPPEHIYPADDWRLVEERFYEPFLGEAETLFSLSNGYIGMRGTPDEGEPVRQGGTFINGFHETWDIVYAEDAHGLAKAGQTMLNVTDAKVIRLYVDDEPFYLPTANLVRFRRVLDMKAGILERDLVWEMPSGKRVAIRSRRLVSFEHRHLAAIDYEVTLLNADAPVVLRSELRGDQPNQEAAGDPRKARGFAEKVLDPRYRSLEDRRIVLGHRTRHSGMALSCAADHAFRTECEHTVRGACSEDHGEISFRIHGKAGKPIRLSKYIAYHTSRRAPAEDLCVRAEHTLDRALELGFDAIAEGQRAWLDGFWERGDVEVDIENRKVQQVLRWSLFQIAQASGRAEGAGIPAKGLTGQTYGGHYFWDTEIYLLPYIIYTEPRIARNLLKFRHSMLGKARKRAREVNQRGALFPWRTINGEEASAYYAAGTAQYHIDADIMYALRKYVDATGDRGFLFGEGAEMLVETARLWLDLGFFSTRKGGLFSINEVTGPDEYNTVVHNNTYTNLMARENLRFAAETVEALRKEDPRGFDALVRTTRLDLSEVEAWKRAAENMYVPFDRELGIHPQDDDFLDKKPWDFAGTPPEKYPLLLHFHPLVIYRHQVIKQADIVLAMFLLRHEFSLEQKKRNFDFYDPLTTGDSSLSVCIQGIVAAEIGYMDKAREYFQHALLMDVEDVAGNVEDGVHMAAAGGVWMGVVYGFAGMRDRGGRIGFDPRLPGRCRRLRFRILVRGRRLEVDLRQDRVRYALIEGDDLVLEHAGEEVRLTRAEPEREIAIDRRPEPIPPEGA